MTYRSPNTALGGQVARNAPWVVSIGFDDVNGKYHHECTGSVISNIAILTAAHCAYNNGTVKDGKRKAEEIKVNFFLSNVSLSLFQSIL